MVVRNSNKRKESSKPKPISSKNSKKQKKPIVTKNKKSKLRSNVKQGMAKRKKIIEEKAVTTRQDKKLLRVGLSRMVTYQFLALVPEHIQNFTALNPLKVKKTMVFSYYLSNDFKLIHKGELLLVCMPDVYYHKWINIKFHCVALVPNYNGFFVVFSEMIDDNTITGAFFIQKTKNEVEMLSKQYSIGFVKNSVDDAMLFPVEGKMAQRTSSIYNKHKSINIFTLPVVKKASLDWEK